MSTFIGKLAFVLVLLSATQHINAQNNNDYRDVEAVMILADGNVWSEKKLEGALIALPDNTNQLVVRLHIPYSSVNEGSTADTAIYMPDYRFNLRMRIDYWKIQRSLTSDKTVRTDGYLTLNHITKLVPVEYTPLPSMTVQDGGFNLNLIMEFNPADFNLAARNSDTRFFIKIGDAPVNRL
ncbi:MAG TPA: hypothetical protein VFI33_07485 [Puia sp.]|nr:hypothetical protein [Puia sp.]